MYCETMKFQTIYVSSQLSQPSSRGRTYKALNMYLEQTNDHVQAICALIGRLQIAGCFQLAGLIKAYLNF